MSSNASRRVRSGLARLLASALLAGLALTTLAGAALAEVRRIEAVGAVGIRDDDRRDPRQRAVEAGLREAVSRVAAELAIDAELVGEEPPDVAGALGDDMVPYTSRFRILEDRGLGPALFVEDAGVAQEYVVVVEVEVEVDRVRSQLAEAGLLTLRGRVAPVDVVALEVEGAGQYPALAELRTLLVDAVGARSAIPRSFERGRTVLAVETSLSPGALVDRLVREAPPHMQIASLASGPAGARVAMRWSPPPAPDEDSLPAVESRGPRRHYYQGGD